MLGDLLASLTDETAATETILRSGDLKLLRAAQEQTAAEGLDLAVFVTQTARRYASEASDEEWKTLMGLLNRSQDPGATCLQRAFAYALHRLS
jgi:hypothetical protein